MGPENAKEKHAISAAEIDDSVELRKWIDGGDHPGNLPCETCHGLVKVRCLVRTLRHVGKGIRAKDALKCRLSSANAVQKVTPRLLRHAPKQERGCVHRTWPFAAQTLA